MLERGIDIITRNINSDEYIQALFKKLHEEIDELLAAQTQAARIEEMADVMEVMQSLIQSLSLSVEEVEQARLAKFLERGSFADQRYVNYVILSDNHLMMQYYREQPDKYPEIE